MDDLEPVLSSPAFATSSAQLCSDISTALQLSGGSITVFGHDYHQSTICATDPLAVRVDSLQLELGEGPRWQTQSTGKQVLVPDLASDEHRDWPLFAVAARELGIASVFSFPMRMGAAVVGSVDLYSRTRYHLDPHQVSLGLSMASRAAPTAVHHATESANDPISAEHTMAPALRREVHQATGMIQAQLDVSATEAFARLRAYAFSSGRSIDDIARDVVGRRLDFSNLPD